jgi:hypothetical protein
MADMSQGIVGKTVQGCIVGIKMAAVLQSGLRRFATRISLRSVVAVRQNLQNYATQDTVTHTGQVNNELYWYSCFKP